MSTAALMQAFIDSYALLLASRKQARLDRVARFIEAFPGMAGGWGGPERLNVFSLFGIQADEVRHSAFLAWLLDPLGSHGEGGDFLREFLAMLGRELPTEIVSRCRVTTEYCRFESTIDVLIHCRGHLAVYVENKINSPEGSHQLSREYRDLRLVAEGLQVPDPNRLAVFLTPHGREPLTGEPSEWTCLSYGEVADMLQRVLPGIADDKTRHMIEDWLHIVPTLMG